MVAAVFSSALLALGFVSESLPSSPVLHEFKIRPLYHQGFNTRGATLDVQIQGADRPVRLLLDTGAKDVVLWSKAARKIGLKQSPDAVLASIGGFNGARAAAWAVKASIQVGPRFVLDNVRVQVLDTAALRDLDGVIGANVFRDFVVELDPARSRMRLLNGFGEDADDADLVTFEQVGHLVFVKTGANDQQIGLALLDTGSSYSAIDVSKAGKMSGPSVRNYVPMRGATGNLAEAGYQLAPVRFDLQSGAAVWDREPMALDLSEMSRTHGVNVRAVIGYPAISHSILQLDYTSKRLRILPPSK